MTTTAGTANAASQTLSRGIRILEVLADAREPLSIDEITTQLGVHRSIAYRLVRTLEAHGLTERDPVGRIQLGTRLAALAAGVARDLQAAALPELTAAANELGMTCLLAVLDHEQFVVLASVEPRHAVAAVAQRPGTRHPVTLGASGKAILSQLAAESWPAGVDAALADQLHEVAVRGWAESQNEVISSVHSVAVPLSLHGWPAAAIAVVYLPSGAQAASIAERLARSVTTIREALGG
jgi:DNA-binding IclR family transcriptional regulator